MLDESFLGTLEDESLQSLFEFDVSDSQPISPEYWADLKGEFQIPEPIMMKFSGGVKPRSEAAANFAKLILGAKQEILVCMYFLTDHRFQALIKQVAQ